MLLTGFKEDLSRRMERERKRQREKKTLGKREGRKGGTVLESSNG